MTKKQLFLQQESQPTLEFIVQDVSQLNRAALLELGAIIEKLLVDQANGEEEVLPQLPQQLGEVEGQQQIEVLALLKQGAAIWNEWREKKF